MECVERLKAELEQVRCGLPEVTCPRRYDALKARIAFIRDVLKKYNPEPRYTENLIK